MKILLYIIIMIGLLMPLSVIYIDQQDASSVHSIAKPIPFTTRPAITLTLTISNVSVATSEPTPTPTATPTPTIIIEPTAVPTPTPISCPRLEYQGEAWACTRTNILKPDGSFIIQCKYGTAMPLQNRAEVEQFMLWDRTNEHPVGEFYNCASYTDDVCQSASKHEIQAYPTILWFADGKVHSIVVFPTVDDGNIFIDVTQGDWWATVEQGEQYTTSNFNDGSSFYGSRSKIIDNLMIYY